MISLFPHLASAKASRKPVVGLDVDEKSVKLVELKRTSSGVALVNFAITEIPPTPPGEDKATVISKTIRSMMSFLGAEPADVYSAISGPGVSIRRITVPEMPEEELYGAVRWEAKNLIPFPLESVTLDYYVIGKIVEKGADKLDIIVVAAQNDVINQQVRLIEQAGVKLSGITANPFALWDVLKMNLSPNQDEIVALIDIGAEAASINLFKNNVLQFTREISVAGDSITKAMTGVLISDQWQLSLTYDQAEKIKTEWGIPREDSQEKTQEGIPLTQILEVMKPTLRRMLNEILRSFDYYKDQFREAKINKVYIGGGSSRLKNLEEYLTAGLGVKVEKVNPLSGLNIELAGKGGEDKLRDAAPRLALALGLAIGEAKSLNLIHLKKFTKKAPEFQKFFEAVKVPGMVWVGALAAVIVLALGFNLYLNSRVHHFRRQLESKRAILTDLKLLAERRDILERISREETRLRETLLLFNSTIPAGVTLTQLTYVNATKAMDISGIASNVKLVGRFLNDLEDSQNFSNAQLLESRSASEGKAMGFRMTFKVD